MKKVVKKAICLTISIAFCSILLTAQSINDSSSEKSIGKEGLNFVDNLSWAQVVEKAKKEDKYIFVDCYASWCGPCKKMDKEVYPLQEVGYFYNSKFVSLKLQLDTTSEDGQQIKALYSDAHYIKEKYNILRFPTFLYFSPEGKILNSTSASMTSADFISLASSVIDPKNNYYLLLKDYKKGKRDLSEMRVLARISLRLFGDTSLSKDILSEYKLNLKNDHSLTKDNIEFMHDFGTRGSNDIGFKYFYSFADSINMVMGDDSYCQSIISNIIYKEIITPVVVLHKRPLSVEPDWEDLMSKIRNQYNDYYCERVITAAKIEWCRRMKDWQNYTKYLVLYVDKFGAKKSANLFFILNNNAWEIFQYSNNRDELNRALSWSSQAMLINPESTYFDTYANILYKLKRIQEALTWEDIAVKQDPNDNTFLETLEKMKKGKPTWVVGN
jgi:thioredoxin-related protein